MFQFPGFASYPYIFRIRYPKWVGFPIQKSTDQSLFAAPHGLSQRTTSFIASCRQGIHQTPFSRLMRSRWSDTRIRASCIGSMLRFLILPRTVMTSPGDEHDRSVRFSRLGKTAYRWNRSSTICDFFSLFTMSTALRAAPCLELLEAAQKGITNWISSLLPTR